MAITSSTRLGLTIWSDEGDEFTRAQLTADHQALDDTVVAFAQGLEADLPAAATPGRLYRATDSRRLRYDDGDEWVNVVTDLGEFPAGSPTVAIGAEAATHVGLGNNLWTGRLAVSSDGMDGPALYLRPGTSAATGDAVLRSVVDGGFTGGPGQDVERACIDTDGAVRIGRHGGSVDPTVPRSAFLTVRPTTTAERGLVVDGMAGATGDLVRANTDGTRRFTVDAKGRLYLSALGDNSVSPATPGGAGVIYCNNVGDLLYKSPSGNVTVLANH